MAFTLLNFLALPAATIFGICTLAEGSEQMDQTLYQFLLEADERATDSFDKATLTLSGGGLGISLAFLKDIAAKPPVQPWVLFVAWGLWTVSVIVVLISFHTSHQITQLLLAEKDASSWVTATWRLNAISLATFILGAILMAVFAALNFQ